MKVESDVTADAGGDGVWGRFLAGKASAVRRNSMKEDLPELFVPMTRILYGSQLTEDKCRPVLRT